MFCHQIAHICRCLRVNHRGEIVIGVIERGNRNAPVALPAEAPITARTEHRSQSAGREHDFCPNGITSHAKTSVFTHAPLSLCLPLHSRLYSTMFRPRILFPLSYFPYFADPNHTYFGSLAAPSPPLPAQSVQCPSGPRLPGRTTGAFPAE